MSNSHLFMKAGFLKVPLQNGVGRYVCQLQRVVLKFCKNHGSSRGMRDFIENDLVDFAKNNPGVVVYLKPRRHRSPIINAEYLNGDKQWVSCANYSKEEITKWLNLLRTQQCDKTGYRARKLIHTDHPSIQGPWTPYTFKEPSDNLLTYPNIKYAEPKNMEETATKKLIKLFEKQKIEDTPKSKLE